MKLTAFLCLVFLMTSALQAELNSSIDTANMAIQYFMADPPLPKKVQRRGQSHWVYKPGYVFGDVRGSFEDGGGTFSKHSGSYKGQTLGVGYNRYVHYRWSVYGWAQGANFRGDSNVTPPGQTFGSISSRSIRTQYFNFHAGLNYQYKRKEFNNYGFSVFFGPYVPMYWHEERYNNNNVNVEADIKGQETFFGALVGIRWDLYWREHWNLQPFAFFGDTFGSNAFFSPFKGGGECRDFRAPNIVRGSLTNAALNETECGNQQEFLYDTQIGGIGLNLTYTPWNLSTNIVSPYLNQLIFDAAYENDKEADLINISFTWHTD